MTGAEWKTAALAEMIANPDAYFLRAWTAACCGDDPTKRRHILRCRHARR